MADLYEVFRDVAKQYPGTKFADALATGKNRVWRIESLLTYMEEDLQKMTKEQREDILSKNYGWFIDPMGDRVIIAWVEAEPHHLEIIKVRFESVR